MPTEQTGERGLAAPTALLVEEVADSQKVAWRHAITLSSVRQISACAQVLDEHLHQARGDT